MSKAIGVRREDKYEWERRAPLTPSHVAKLVQAGVEVYVQPSALRVFPEEAYREAGATVQEDLSPCSTIVGVKEIPLEFFQKGKTYLFFSHTAKGQPYNMPMLKRMMDMGCQLVDYERILDDQGKAAGPFRKACRPFRHARIPPCPGRTPRGRRAGRAAESFRSSSNSPTSIANLEEARAHLQSIGDRIRRDGLPASLAPFVVGFLGYGNVSRGAQELLDCLPVTELQPEMLFSLERLRPVFEDGL